MKEVSLSGSPRANVGKKDAKNARKAGHVPCVVYGSGSQTHFNVKHVEMEKLIYTPNVYLVNLEIEGKSTRAIIQDIQFHPVTDRILHVDFIELSDDKQVKIEIPIKLIGRSPGVLAGGKLQQIFRRVKVSALPDALPDNIEVDISVLKIGGAVRIKDIQIEGLELLNAPNAVVVSVKMARGAAQDDEEEEEAAEGAEGEEAEAAAEA